MLFCCNILIPQPRHPHPSLFYQLSLSFFRISYLFGIVLFFFAVILSFQTCLFDLCLPNIIYIFLLRHLSFSFLSLLWLPVAHLHDLPSALSTFSQFPAIGLYCFSCVFPSLCPHSLCCSCPRGASEEQRTRWRGGVDQCRERGDARGEDLGGGDGRGAEDGASCRWKFRRQLSEYSWWEVSTPQV